MAVLETRSFNLCKNSRWSQQGDFVGILVAREHAEFPARYARLRPGLISEISILTKRQWEFKSFGHEPLTFYKIYNSSSHFTTPGVTQEVRVRTNLGVAQLSNGPTGRFKVVFLSRLTRFEEAAHRDFLENRKFRLKSKSGGLRVMEIVHQKTAVLLHAGSGLVAFVFSTPTVGRLNIDVRLIDFRHKILRQVCAGDEAESVGVQLFKILRAEFGILLKLVPGDRSQIRVRVVIHLFDHSMQSYLVLLVALNCAPWCAHVLDSRFAEESRSGVESVVLRDAVL